MSRKQGSLVTFSAGCKETTARSCSTVLFRWQTYGKHPPHHPVRLCLTAFSYGRRRLGAPQEANNVVDLIDTRDYLEFNLTLEMEPYRGGVNAKATYQPSVLSADIVEILLRQLEQIARHVMNDPDILVSDLDQSLPTSLLSIANPEPQNFVYRQGLGTVLEKHAEQNPDKLALCFASRHQ